MISLNHLERTPASQHRAGGWRVALPGGEEASFFPDTPGGGALASLLCAVRWRDRVHGMATTPLRWTTEELERVERGGLAGWWVSATLGNDVLDADLFEDEAHGGLQGALAAALRWRFGRERRKPPQRGAGPARAPRKPRRDPEAGEGGARGA
jgi:hypothetical protein